MIWLLLAAAIALGLLASALWFPDAWLRAEFARERWSAGLELRAQQIDGERWTWAEGGNGPLLLLLHGYTGGKENWYPLAGILKKHFRVIAPDLPGWGQSQRDAGADYGYTAQAQRLARFIETQGEGRPVALVGHSMGGGIAALLAARFPDCIDKLVLMDASGVRHDDNAFGEAVLRGEQPFAVHDASSLRRFLTLVFAKPPWVPWPFSAALIARRQRETDFEREVLQAISGPDAFLPGQESVAIRAPTLLFWCRDDHVIDASAAALYAARIPQAHIFMQDGCNHMPMLERTAATAKVLQEFLQ